MMNYKRPLRISIAHWDHWICNRPGLAPKIVQHAWLNAFPKQPTLCRTNSDTTRASERALSLIFRIDVGFNGV